MKVFIKIIFFTMLLKQSVSAQNVGIGTTTPQGKLDINGDVVLQNANITLANGANDNIDISTQKFSHYTISGPNTVFEIGGLSGGVDGRMVTLYNSSAFLMVVKHLSAGSIAANEIHTGTGLDFTLSSYSSATFRYLSLDNLWHIQSTHNDFVTGSGTNYWTANGVDISSTNTGNIGIGNASPSFKLDVTGNQRNIGTAMTSPGAVGNLTSGGIFRMQNTLGNKFLLFDGSTIQAQQSNTNFSGSTAQPLLLNPFGSNVGIGYNIPTATLDVGRGSAVGGTAAFRGTTHVSHINFGAAEDTYIRAGKTGSKVYINDSHNGDVNIAAGGGDVALSSNNGKINVNGNQIYAPQTGGLNIVPIGVIKYSYFIEGSGNINSINITNLAGTLATSGWTETHETGIDDYSHVFIDLSTAITNQYTSIFATCSGGFNHYLYSYINRYDVFAFKGATSSNLRIFIAVDGFDAGITLNGTAMIYGIK